MKRVITIGRQYGSAGHDIGEMVAEALGYSFYDKELVELAARASNIAPEAVKGLDEKATSSLLYSLANGSYSVRGMSGPLYYEMPLNDKLFLAQSEIIKEKAKSENCVIVGRCADYVLEEEEDIELINVFIHAPADYRIQRVADAFGLTAKKAKERVVKTDKQRKTYYNYYANRDWGEIENYDICLNSGTLGIERSAKMIIDYIRGLDK